MNSNKIRTKANCGPGGIKCACCNSMGNVKAARTLHNRIIRRKAKIALRNFSDRSLLHQGRRQVQALAGTAQERCHLGSA